MNMKPLFVFCLSVLSPVAPLSVEKNNALGVRHAQRNITRKLHFIFGLWDDRKSMPLEYKENKAQWEKLNPDWQVKLWLGKKKCRKFVAEHYPANVLEAYGASSPIQQADFLRYLILLKHGGLYADLDTRPSISAEHLINNLASHTSFDSVVFTERVFGQADLNLIEERSADLADLRLNTEANPQRQGFPETSIFVSNWILYSEPGTLLMEALVSECSRRLMFVQAGPLQSKWKKWALQPTLIDGSPVAARLQ